MGCACSKKSGVKYEVSFHDGKKQTYSTIGEAQAAGSASGQPYTFKAVAA